MTRFLAFDVTDATTFGAALAHLKSLSGHTAKLTGTATREYSPCAHVHKRIESCLLE